MIYAIFGAIILITIGSLILYLRHDNKEIGSAEEKAQNLEGILDDVYVAKKARDALSHNNKSAKLLRDKYTRK